MTPEQKDALFTVYYGSFDWDSKTARCRQCKAQGSIPWKVVHDDSCAVEMLRAMLWPQPRESYPNPSEAA